MKPAIKANSDGALRVETSLVAMSPASSPAPSDAGSECAEGEPGGGPPQARGIRVRVTRTVRTDDAVRLSLCVARARERMHLTRHRRYPSTAFCEQVLGLMRGKLEVEQSPPAVILTLSVASHRQNVCATATLPGRLRATLWAANSEHAVLTTLQSMELYSRARSASEFGSPGEASLRPESAHVSGAGDILATVAVGLPSLGAGPARRHMTAPGGSGVHARLDVAGGGVHARVDPAPPVGSPSACLAPQASSQSYGTASAPQSPSGVTAASTKAERVARRRARGVRVLFVDDLAVNRRMGSRMLERLGCVVDTADDGDEVRTRASCTAARCSAAVCSELAYFRSLTPCGARGTISR